mmetsp:Transcript_117951/g.328654  ORF Transcript_117951/g.328654 Transcript_117951/m.328654 type:complete len:132 (-) Transcript_117951:207-602(-)
MQTAGMRRTLLAWIHIGLCLALVSTTSEAGRRDGSANTRTGLNLLQIVSLPGTYLHKTHVDPLNVRTATIDKARYDEDWTTEWRPNPNIPNTSRTVTTMTTTTSTGGAPSVCGLGAAAAVFLGLVHIALHS